MARFLSKLALSLTLAALVLAANAYVILATVGLL
jgi:hypothetical protein